MKQWLVAQGFSEARIVTEGYGSERPLVDAQGQEALMRMNRRVEILMVCTDE